MKFIIPFFYSYISRFKNPVKAASWGFIYVIPLVFLGIYQNGILGLAQVTITICVIYTVYEIGYLQNDVFTIKEEKNPTLRLNASDRDFVERHIYIILCSRFAITAALIIIYALIDNKNAIFILILSLLIPVVFYVYNSVRSRLNLFIHFILVNLRYTSIGILFLDYNKLFFLMMLFPVINLLERCSEERFSLKYFQNFILSNKKSGRYIYYFWLSLSIYVFSGTNNIMFALSIYYFLYRFLSLYAFDILGKYFKFRR